MHLQQTKRASRASGGPQYYFHDLTEPVKMYLRKKGSVRVALITPYGATKSDFFAVSQDRKLDANHQAVPGKVGHDRIQQGKAGKSIGESIREWYKLPIGDFERIDVDINIYEETLYITPLYFKFVDSKKRKPIRKDHSSLNFTHDFISSLWTRQLANIEKHNKGIVRWSVEEIARIITDHRSRSKVAHIQEPDLLRASGPLAHLGMKLGAYVGRGYDCQLTTFQFLDYPQYTIPVEIKKRSQDFQYQQKKYGKDELSRALVLCAFHNHSVIPQYIDVIELDALCSYSVTTL